MKWTTLPDELPIAEAAVVIPNLLRGGAVATEENSLVVFNAAGWGVKNYALAADAAQPTALKSPHAAKHLGDAKLAAEIEKEHAAAPAGTAASPSSILIQLLVAGASRLIARWLGA